MFPSVILKSWKVKNRVKGGEDLINPLKLSKLKKGE